RKNKETGTAGDYVKPPFQARNGQPASTTDSKTWCSLPTAYGAYRRGGYDGIGFVPLPKDEMTFIDLDRCRDRQTGKVARWAQQIVREIDSYTEVSPSGTGLRIIARGR